MGVPALGLVSDIRAGWRIFFRNRRAWGVTALLGLAIGASAAFLGFIDAALRHPVRGVDEVDRVIVLGGIAQGASIGDPLEWWKAPRIEHLARYRVGDARVGPDEAGQWTRVAEVSAEFFRVFALPPHEGRDFSGDDARLARPAAVISSTLRDRLSAGSGGSPIPRTIEVNELTYDVVGVARDQFDFPSGADVWLLEATSRDRRVTLVPGASTPLPARNQAGWIARMHPGASMDEVKQQLTAILERTNESLGAKTGRRYGSTVTVMSLGDYLFLPVRPAARAMQWGTLFVVLAVAANTFTFFLGAALRRRHEFAVRRALGASGLQLVRLAIGEALAVGLTASSIAVLVSRWVVDASRELLTAAGMFIPLGDAFGLRIAGWGALACVTISIVAATAPTVMFGLRVPRGGMNDRSDSGGALGPIYRMTLISISAALALLLSVGAVLTTNAVWKMLSAGSRLATDGVHVARLRLHRDTVVGNRLLAVQAETLDRVRRIPGVLRAGFGTSIPIRNEDRSFLSAAAEGRSAMVASTAVAGDFLEALAIQSVRGTRVLDDEHAVILNEAAAQYFWNSLDVIGRTITVAGESRQVIGVVLSTTALNEAEAKPLELYRPVVPLTGASGVFVPMALVVRCANSCERDLERLMHEMFGRTSSTVVAVESLRRGFERAMAPYRTRSRLWLLYATIGVGVGLTGVLNLVGYVVLARRHEAAIRTALGATPRMLAWTISGEAVRAVTAGTVLGAIAARAGSRVSEGLLGSEGFADITTLTTIAAALIITLSLSALVPALRAMRQPLSVHLR